MRPNPLETVPLSGPVRVGAEVVVDGNFILCRTRLEEAERHLREFEASLPPGRDLKLRAADALAHIREAIELLRIEDPGPLYGA